MLKAVLDTNVLISALTFKSKLRPVREALKNDKFSLVFSPITFNEFVAVLRRPKISSLIDSDAESLLLELIKDTAVFVPESKSSETFVKEDPSDDAFLLAAEAAKADLIVSGDKHLLSLKSFCGIPIVTASFFLKKLK